jgi:type III secretion protein V
MPKAFQEFLDVDALNQQMLSVRRALYLDQGIPFPGIHLRFNESLTSDQYIIHIQETPITVGYIKRGHILINGQDDQLKLFNIPFEKGDDFLPNYSSVWVPIENKEKIEKLELSYFKSDDIITYHLSFVLRKYAPEFIGIQQTRFLLEKMEDKFSELTKEAQRILPLQRIAEILKRLVSEEVSIRNLQAILEAIIEWGQKEKDNVILTEYVRTNLKRYLSYKHSNGSNVLPAYLLDSDVEEQVRASIRQTSAGSYLAMDPQVAKKIVDNVVKNVGNIQELNNKPVIVTAMDIRRYIRKMIESELYDLSVLSYQELTQEISVQPLGRISLT